MSTLILWLQIWQVKKAVSRLANSSNVVHVPYLLTFFHIGNDWSCANNQTFDTDEFVHVYRELSC